MDKISNMNFTGISNIAGVRFSRKENTISRSLSMVLSDDFSGKDFEEFKSIISKITKNPDDYSNPILPDILNIECYSKKKSNSAYKNSIFINGKKLAVNDNNLPIFSYIALLSKKIIAFNDKNFKVNDDYKKYFANDAIIYGISIDKSSFQRNIDKTKLINFSFNPESVKNTSQYINDFVQDLMNRYFGVK